MFKTYLQNEIRTRQGEWGKISDTFFPGEQEKYFGFGDMVQLSDIQLNPHSLHEGMKLRRNFESVNIILNGSISYQDGEGRTSSFPEKSVQVFSAGKGIYRLECNRSDSVLRAVQIGFLPDVINTQPIQTKALFDLDKNLNSFVEIVSPLFSSSTLSVRQKAAILLGKFEEGNHIGYQIHNDTTGVFIYVIDGAVTMKEQTLINGESCSISGIGDVMLHTASESTILLIETVIQLEGTTDENIYGGSTASA